MVKFIEVNPADIPNVREAHRGRVSYPILKSFLEASMFIAQLDRTGLQQTTTSIYSSLSAYVRSHEMPIKIFSRKGEIFLMRLDIDEKGNEIPNWQHFRDVDTSYEPAPIDEEEVSSRYEDPASLQ